MDVTWADVASLVVLLISSSATIWVAIAAVSTSRSAARTAALALEVSELRETRDDRLAVFKLINTWAEEIAILVMNGEEQHTVPPDFGAHLASVDGAEPIVDWYLSHVNALVAKAPGISGQAIRMRGRAEMHLRTTLANRAKAWVRGGIFDESPVDLPPA